MNVSEENSYKDYQQAVEEFAKYTHHYHYMLPDFRSIHHGKVQTNK